MIQSLTITEACQYIKRLLSMNYSLLCIGTYLRSDDAACLELCDKLQATGIYNNIVKCEFGLENCFDEVLQHKRDSVIICDAIISHTLKPGTIAKFDLKDIDEGIEVLTTHTIPLTYSINILIKMGSVKNIELIGIVAQDLSIGMQLSEAIKNTVEQLYNCLKS